MLKEKIAYLKNLAKATFWNTLLDSSFNLAVVILFILVLLFFSGCGHNRYLENKSTGVAISIPFGELGSLDICLGSKESSTAMVRGGSSITTESASGAGLFAAAGGASRITTIKFNEQLNEGNIVKVMLDTNVPNEAKIALAKNITTQAPEFQPSALQTREANLYSNGFTNQLEAPFQTTGVDKVIEEVADVTETVADDVAEGAGHTAAAIVDTTKKVIENVDSTTKKVIDKADVTDNFGNKIKDAVINGTANISRTVAMILTIVIALVLFIVIVFSGNKKKTKPPKVKSSPVLNATAPSSESSTVEDEQLKEELGDMPVPEFTQYPQKNWFVRFFEGLGSFLKSMLHFWHGIPKEERQAAIDTAKEFLSKKKQKQEDETTPSEE